MITRTTRLGLLAATLDRAARLVPADHVVIMTAAAARFRKRLD